VIATVGDYDLTLGELIAVRQALPQQYQSLPPEVLKEGLMEQLVNQTVLAVRAREEGLDEAPEVALALRNLENSTLADSFMRRRMQERVTAEAIEEAYEARYEGAEPEQEVKAAHILVETKEEAEALRAEIEEGAEFAALAREHGTDGTAQRGGDLGWFVQGDMVPEFADAAFALEPGVVSEPVETPFGWHLILVEERRDRAAPPLEEVRQEIAQELAQQAQQEIIDEARGAVEITRPEREIPVEALMADELISGDAAE
jgi:peptidyl-prolyl cis-trans isomerase C